MGELTDWYVLIRAAKYLGVAPWELASRGMLWQHAAIQAEAAENEAQKALQEQQQQQAQH